MNSSLTDMVWGYTSAPPTIRLWSVWAFHSGIHCVTKLRLLWARTSCVALWRTWGSTGLCSAKGGSCVCVCEGGVVCVTEKKILLAVGPRGLLRAKQWSSTPLRWLRQDKDVKKKKSCPTLQQRKKKKKLSHVIGWGGIWQENAMAQEVRAESAINVIATDNTFTDSRAAGAQWALTRGIMSASVAVYRNIYTEDRFKQAYGSEQDGSGGSRLRERLAGRCRCSRRACLHLLRQRVPIFSWLPRYRPKKWILGDTIAGLTVGILHIPQGEQTTHLDRKNVLSIVHTITFIQLHHFDFGNCNDVCDIQ